MAIRVRVFVAVSVAASMMAVAACSKEPAAPAAEASHDAHGAGRVFFVSPKNGETVMNPVKFEFGSEGVTIAAVPAGDVTSSRPGMAHYHLGIDTDCLPAGEAIPKGVPTWVHFGTGSNTLEYPAPTPGKHKFVLEAGDDQHKAVSGLCETIEITVQ